MRRCSSRHFHAAARVAGALATAWLAAGCGPGSWEGLSPGSAGGGGGQSATRTGSGDGGEGGGGHTEESRPEELPPNARCSLFSSIEVRVILDDFGWTVQKPTEIGTCLSVWMRFQPNPLLLTTPVGSHMSPDPILVHTTSAKLSYTAHAPAQMYPGSLVLFGTAILNARSDLSDGVPDFGSGEYELWVTGEDDCDFDENELHATTYEDTYTSSDGEPRWAGLKMSVACEGNLSPSPTLHLVHASSGPL